MVFEALRSRCGPSVPTKIEQPSLSPSSSTDASSCVHTDDTRLTQTSGSTGTTLSTNTSSANTGRASYRPRTPEPGTGLTIRDAERGLQALAVQFESLSSTLEALKRTKEAEAELFMQPQPEPEAAPEPPGTMQYATASTTRTNTRLPSPAAPHRISRTSSGDGTGSGNGPSGSTSRTINSYASIDKVSAATSRTSIYSRCSEGFVEMSKDGAVFVPDTVAMGSISEGARERSDGALEVNFGRRKERKLIKARLGDDGHLYHEDAAMSEICRQIDSAELGPMRHAAPPVQGPLPFTLYDKHKQVFHALKELLNHAMTAVRLAEDVRSCAEEHVLAVGRDTKDPRGAVYRRALRSNIQRMEQTVRSCLGVVRTLSQHTYPTDCLPFQALTDIIYHALDWFSVEHVLSNVPRTRRLQDEPQTVRSRQMRDEADRNSVKRTNVDIEEQNKWKIALMHRSVEKSGRGLTEDTISMQRMAQGVSTNLGFQLGRLYHVATILIRSALAKGLAFESDLVGSADVAAFDERLRLMQVHKPALAMHTTLSPLEYITVNRSRTTYTWLGKGYARPAEAEQAVLRTIEDEIEFWNKADTSIIFQLMELLDFENQWGIKMVIARRRAMFYMWLDTVRNTPRKMRACSD